MDADSGLRIAIVEKDPTYERASATLSMANVRIQFSLEANIKISRYAFEVLETFDDDMAVEGDKAGIHFQREGNLFLVGEEDLEAARRGEQLGTGTVIIIGSRDTTAWGQPGSLFRLLGEV
jgi:hypothetical protein